MSEKRAEAGRLSPAEFENKLICEGSVTYPFRGSSMAPLLKEGRCDRVTVRKKTGRLRRFDVALYREESAPGSGAAGAAAAGSFAAAGGRRGKYILHRVVGVAEDGYVTRGDNCKTLSFVEEGRVIGVLCSFHRTSSWLFPARNISADHWAVRLYGRLRGIKL